jgi:hypothetical protein
VTASRTLRTFGRRVNSGAGEEAEKLVMTLFKEKVVMVNVMMKNTHIGA